MVVLRSAGEPLNPGTIATFSVDHKSGRELRQYLSSVADQCEHGSAELPCVIILDSLHHVTSLSEVFNGFLSVHYQTRSASASTCYRSCCIRLKQKQNTLKARFLLREMQMIGTTMLHTNLDILYTCNLKVKMVLCCPSHFLIITDMLIP